MSWLEQVQSDFIITTGDGKEFKPLWVLTTKTIEYNIAEFEFPNLPGTLVNRGQPKGRKFNLEIHFEGEDYLDQSNAFEASANDPRAWVILHPMYGSITVQPTGLLFDNTKYNDAKITGTLIETIVDDNPITTINPIDNIVIEKANLDEKFVTAFDTTPKISDVNTMTASVNKYYTLGKKITNVASESEAYFNLFNKANSAISTAIAVPLFAIRATQAMINAPANFSVAVKTRVDCLTSQFGLLRNTLSSISGRSSKKVYESQGGAFISSLVVAAGTPFEGDYGNMNSVLSIIESIINSYNNYLSDLDSIQTDNGGDVDSFIPDADSLISLNALVNSTISALFTVALNSKQERAIILEEDSNIILLTHRVYGIDPFDANIEELINNNNIGLNELLQIRKGRTITYFI